MGQQVRLNPLVEHQRLVEIPFQAVRTGGSKNKASIASRTSSGMGAGLLNTSRAGTFSLNSNREVPGPRRRRQSHSSTAFLAQVMFGA